MTDVLSSALGTSTASGVPGVGDVPYGTHFCHFYDGRDDLEDTLVPFFEAGLHRNEACLWVTSEPFRADEAREALAAVVPDLAERERLGQIEIIDHTDWYLHGGAADAASTLRGWIEREERAIRSGFAGLRLTGNTAWLERKDWKSFVEYERTVDEAFRPRRIVALCSYCLTRCTPTDVLDVVRNHQFAVARREGTWDVLEASSLRIARQDLARVRQALEAEREAKQRIEALQEHNRALIETIPQLVWTASADGRIDDVNGRWTDYTGLDRDRLARGGWVEAIHPEDRAAAATEWARARHESRRLEIEARLLARDGSYRWFLVQAAPLRGAEGELRHWFGTCTDIQDQKAAGLALREADQRKDQFLAMLGHELRNPLSPILTALQLLEIQGDFRREHEVIERQARHLGRLVDDLLDVARITSGQLELRRRNVELVEIVARGIEQAGPLIEKHRHRLLKDVPASGLEVNVDPARLAQVVGNLLTNAAKYTSPGGRIVISGRRDASGDVVLTVADDGPGIPGEILPRLFEPFAQSRQNLDRSHGGLGLGLTIVNSLVVAHGGRVVCESEPGVGTTFSVTLPRPVSTEQEGVTSDALRLSLPPPSRRVLIVEDNPDAALMLGQALRLVGHHVETAYDAVAALELAPSFQPEVCVLDIGLPVMDGYELARRLRKVPSLDGVRLIALTGYGQDSDRRLAREAGFERHVLKPVDLRLLRSLIEEEFNSR